MNTKDRLAEMGVIPDEDELSPTGQRWQVTTKQDLEFSLQRLGELEAQVEHINKTAMLAISQVELRAQALISKVNRGIDYFEKQIAAYAEENKQALLGAGKRKTWSGLHGSVSWRKKGGRLKVVDEAAVLAWADQPDGRRCHIIKTTPSVDKRLLNEWFDAFGEIPDGCEVEPEREELSVSAEPPIEGLSKLEE
jgi:phage host-nuclease inhibitor protein Gam